MTPITKGIFLIAVALLIASAIFQMPIAAGGGAVVLMAGLVYAFVVSKRDVERLEATEQ